MGSCEPVIQLRAIADATLTYAPHPAQQGVGRERNGMIPAEGLLVTGIAESRP